MRKENGVNCAIFQLLKLDLLPESCIIVQFSFGRIFISDGKTTSTFTIKPPVAQFGTAPAIASHEACSGVAGGEQEDVTLTHMFYTYVLKSNKDGKLYVGYSDNLKKRIAEHYEGRVDATKHRRPLQLVYYEACLSKIQALKREKYFKSGFGRKYLYNRIQNIPCSSIGRAGRC